MRPLGIAAFACISLAAACSPDVYPDVYLCGPEQLCPPEQACSPRTETCRDPRDAEPFECPLESNVAEPDDLDAQARAVTLGCAGNAVELSGCIIDGEDLDQLLLTIDNACVGNRVELTIRQALTFAPVAVNFTDIDGTALAVTSCPTAPDTGGDASDCLAVDSISNQVRVTLTARQPDCDGTCAFNRYALSIRVSR